ELFSELFNELLIGSLAWLFIESLIELRTALFIGLFTGTPQLWIELLIELLAKPSGLRGSISSEPLQCEEYFFSEISVLTTLI
ncbi:hypothetical protein, partial [Methanosarcina sp. A14]|uniref:hypothetical protein n=2 Tax=Methanosarcina TaxID=2207 RepID=UPI001C40850F